MRRRIPPGPFAAVLVLWSCAFAGRVEAQSFPPDCPAGKYSATGTEPCTDCVAGTTSGPGSTSCTPCSPGSVAPASGSAQCQPCPAGTEMPNFGGAACQPCAGNTIAPFAGTASCQPCPAGTIADATHTQCVSNTLCPVGQYSASGTTPCTDCQAGYYADQAGSQACAPCAAGTFAPTTGSAVCSTCPDGSIAQFTGSVACSPCPSGTTSDPSHTQCVSNTLCPVGQYSASGTTPCTDCQAGYYADQAGSQACAPCAAGTFAPATGSAACSPCPDGSIAPFLGSAACTPCPSWQTSNASHTECVGVAGVPADAVPRASFLGAPRPNPTRDGTAFEVGLAAAGPLRVTVHDASGRLLRALEGGPHAAGTYRLAWDLRTAAGTRVAPGVYYVRVASGTFRAMRAVQVTR